MLRYRLLCLTLANARCRCVVPHWRLSFDHNASLVASGHRRRQEAVLAPYRWLGKVGRKVCVVGRVKRYHRVGRVERVSQGSVDATHKLTVPAGRRLCIARRRRPRPTHPRPEHKRLRPSRGE